MSCLQNSDVLKRWTTEWLLILDQY